MIGWHQETRRRRAACTSWQSRKFIDFAAFENKGGKKGKKIKFVLRFNVSLYLSPTERTLSLSRSHSIHLKTAFSEAVTSFSDLCLRLWLIFSNVCIM